MSATDETTTSAGERLKRNLRGLWAKLNEDWLFNFSGLLAYSYLTALAPILLALVAIGSLALSALAPTTYNTFVQNLASIFPADLGNSLVNAILTALRQEAGVLLTIALLAAIFAGSRLFVTLEDLFAVIYRTTSRRLIQQNFMAIMMMLLFIVMAPLLFIAATLPSTFLRDILPQGAQSSGVALTIAGIVSSIVFAFIIFGAIYLVVPNRTLPFRAIWPGALIASALLNLFEAIFPLYRAIFLQNPGYGTAIGLAIVVLAFLYFVGVITLLGAEVNSWAMGLRPRGANLPEIARRADAGADSDAPPR